MGDADAKLDLLSTTAILKLDVAGNTATASKAPSLSVSKGPIVEASSFGQSTTATNGSAPSPTNSVISTISKPIFSVASSASVSGLLMQVQDSSITVESPANKNSKHLASPVSADGDEEEQNNGEEKGSSTATDSASKAATAAAFTGTLANSVSTHSLQQIIESRSPVPSVEYRQGAGDGPSPPPPSYGYGLHAPYEAAFPPNGVESSAFTSIGGASMGTVPGSIGNFPHGPHSAPGMMYHHHQQRQLPSPHQHHTGHKGTLGTSRGQTQPSSTPSTYEEMARELAFVRNQLKEKDMVVSSLQHRVNFLENQINELRQLPTGKISHIPVE